MSTTNHAVAAPKRSGDHQTPTGAGGDSLSDRLAEDVAAVVREEVEVMRVRLAEAGRPAATGVVLLAAAGGCAVLGLGAASATALRVLERLLPRSLATAGLTAGYLAAAVLLGGIALDQLRAAGGGSERLAGELRQAAQRTLGRAVPAGMREARRDIGE
jgi:Putative Actinobacterial Holin-X, holin superfamily III